MRPNIGGPQKIMNNHSRQVEDEPEPEPGPEPAGPVNWTQPRWTRGESESDPKLDPLVLLYGIGRHPIKRHSLAIKRRIPPIPIVCFGACVQHFAVFFAIRELLKCR